MEWGSVFAQGLSYRDFLAKHATPDQQKRWQAGYDSVTLTGDQRELLGGFVREMHVLCIAGAWCGDCVNQCPILARIAEQNPRIAVRFVDRDVQAAAQEAAMMNGGRRVPVVMFLSEDDYECGRYGDRTLATYRQMGEHNRCDGKSTFRRKVSYIREAQYGGPPAGPGRPRTAGPVHRAHRGGGPDRGRRVAAWRVPVRSPAPDPDARQLRDHGGAA